MTNGFLDHKSIASVAFHKGKSIEQQKRRNGGEARIFYGISPFLLFNFGFPLL
jgi:hypothetical protein